jgi:hypothetical protein
VRAAGATVVTHSPAAAAATTTDNSSSDSSSVKDVAAHCCEVSPLLSLAGEGLEWLAGRELSAPFCLDAALEQLLRGPEATAATSTTAEEA